MVEKLRQARAIRDESEQHLHETIVAAYKAGGGMREIGDAVGMSYTGVAKLLERLEVRERDGSGPDWVRGRSA